MVQSYRGEKVRNRSQVGNQLRGLSDLGRIEWKGEAQKKPSSGSRKKGEFTIQETTIVKRWDINLGT